MSLRLTVGKSFRTPAKHCAMCVMAGREKGVSGKIQGIEDLHWFDLSAGDGLVDDGRPCNYADCDRVGCWSHNCSPGILASYARSSFKPVVINLYEIAPGVFDDLEKALDARLPKLGYRYSDGWWRHGDTVRLRAQQQNGADADISAVGFGSAVFVSNDPNAIHDWVMRPTFAAEIRARTRFMRAISTMGCNASGIKRGMPIDERRQWYELIEQQKMRLPRNHDLMLARIVKDSHQWAYLFNEPIVWRAQSTRDITRSFRRHDMEIDYAWLRVRPSTFRMITDELFLTKRERGA